MLGWRVVGCLGSIWERVFFFGRLDSGLVKGFGFSREGGGAFEGFIREIFGKVFFYF